MRRLIARFNLAAVLVTLAVTPGSTLATEIAPNGGDGGGTALFLVRSNGDGTANCNGPCNRNQPLCYCCGC